MTIKSSISLSDEQHAFAKRLVEDGRFGSVSAVMQKGLDLLQETIEEEEMTREALRRVLQRRLEGEFISGAEMDERLEAMLARKQREQEL